jgi:CheY-like chemotaxis protein
MSGALQVTPCASERSTVIIAEDYDMLRCYFVDVLEAAGYEVLSAANGMGAFELLRNRPDAGILLTDIEMPGMDGLALARRAREYSSGIGVLYVSGSGRDRVAREAVPGALFLAKPCTSRALCEAIAGMFGSKRHTVADAA